MNSIDMVKVLKGVPECRLRLIELAWNLAREDGSIDSDRLAFYSKEIGEAISEAEAYRDATREAVRCLTDHFQS